MSLGGAAAAGGSAIVRLGSVPGEVLGLPLSKLVGVGLCVSGGLAALGGLLLAAIGPRRPGLAAIVLGTIGVDGLFLLGALSSNAAMIRTPLANMLFFASNMIFVTAAGFWRGEVVADPAAPPASAWRFPGWSGPIVGAAVGAWTVLIVLGPSLAVAAGAAVGLAAGVVVYARAAHDRAGVI